MPTQDTKVNLVINEMDEEQLNALEQAGTVPPNQVFCTNDDSEMPPYLWSKTNIPNSILEAPNGIITTGTNSITLKAGTVLVIPNGLNTDGTPNNIVHTVASDVSYTVGSGDTNQRNVWYHYNTNGLLIGVWNLGPCMSAPIARSSTYERYFDVPKNKWYEHNTSTTTWSEMTPVCFLAQYTTTNGNLTFLVPPATLNIAHDKVVYESYISSTAFFRAWESGFKEIWFQAKLTGSWKDITIPFPKGYKFRNTQFSVVATSNGSRCYLGVSTVSGGAAVNAAYASGTNYSMTTEENIRFYCCGY